MSYRSTWVQHRKDAIPDLVCFHYGEGQYGAEEGARAVCDDVEGVRGWRIAFSSNAREKYGSIREHRRTC